ncbi:chromosome segregation protein SMC [Arthrobacter sp. MYb227]|uniref:AAA family ATPase n=1 Tax=Arthrobacter sp. MYb227 TaxID=1848601 RepID=UPI000CFD4B7F|nr:SMC family ATPase [Arthrobacter sp. MYb227]PQZ92145.1 chromosome segregation protein SMC [Arthrobacter sp. MYb227]
MRVHSLEMQAFGPFAKRAIIDFDALSEGGIFLLNGETGAGKTSVLDGICYALYGSLPGVRLGTKSLRSDHAGADIVPEVTCVFSTSGRRFEVTRSPAWDRPSKRGKNGTTLAQAQSRLRELVDGVWVEKSTRNDEVSQALSDVLGLDREQFTKVAMLPQGAFAEFLRAKDKDREELLRKLFDTTDYAMTERILGERFAAAKLEAEEAERQQRTAIEQLMSDAIGTLFSPEGELSEADTQLLQDGAIDELGVSFENALETKREVLGRQREQADERLDSSRTVQETLSARVKRHAQFAELTELRKTHEAQAPEILRLLADLELDRVASGIGAYHQQVLDALETHRDAETVLKQSAQAGLSALTNQESEALGGQDAALFERAQLGGATAEDIQGLSNFATDAAQRATKQAAVIEAALPDEAELEATKKELTKLENGLRTQHAEQRIRAEATQKIREELPELEVASTSAEAVLASLPGLNEAVDRATERRESVIARDKALQAQLKVHGEFNEAQGHTLTLREGHQELFTLRLEQSAASLAAQLHAGEECLVCGSVEHPNPATVPEGELVSSGDLEQAQHAVELSQKKTERVAARLEAANTALAVLRDKVGELELGEAKAELDVATFALGQATALSATATRAALELDAAHKQLETLLEATARATTAIEVAQTKSEGAKERIIKLAENLAVLGGAGQDLRNRHTELGARAGILEKLVREATTLLGAQRAAMLAQQQWNRKLAEANIADTQAWEAQLLPALGREAAKTRTNAHEQQSVRISTLADAPETALARTEAELGIGTPSDEELSDAADTVNMALAARDEVLAADAVLSSYAGRLESGRNRLTELAREQGPVIEKFTTLKSMADLARGLGENRLKMTLSTYVLAARLEAVALAATQRLMLMSGQRYALVHDDTPRGNNKSGLGLQILDAWTGVRRDTQTLSGGESFMASLALALGLADVIQQQSGGIDIETLFVDEGFGSLDADTLEQVMDALEALRSGGRVIGVVSHVADMKQRIATRLNVHKGRNGSTVSMDITG